MVSKTIRKAALNCLIIFVSLSKRKTISGLGPYFHLTQTQQEKKYIFLCQQKLSPTHTDTHTESHPHTHRELKWVHHSRLTPIIAEEGTPGSRRHRRPPHTDWFGVTSVCGPRVLIETPVPGHSQGEMTANVKSAAFSLDSKGLKQQRSERVNVKKYGANLYSSMLISRHGAGITFRIFCIKAGATTKRFCTVIEIIAAFFGV